MDDSQESTISISKEFKRETPPTDEVFLSQLGSQSMTVMSQTELENEIFNLERDIRQQKESSMNAKTAINPEQLRKIYEIGNALGPHKETFFDRICRAAEIQRASLKNRLKQNKDRFDFSQHGRISLLSTPLNDSQQSSGTDTQFQVTQNTIQFLCSTAPTTTTTTMWNSTRAIQPEARIPAERQRDLLWMGFPYDEMKQVLKQFLNRITINPPQNLKQICIAYTLLELDNPVEDVQKAMMKSKRPRRDSDSDEDLLTRKRVCANASPLVNDQIGKIPRDMVLNMDKYPLDGTQPN
ncbi:unnamed protein product [Caenorhabditis bovis]|uniref:Uncharacterized protein n=1 Tax=Caenorhabditis bovis TaxID=2654633 RepID=A0A8S1ELH1_9PELO|nr:unnamed protein product [Caenorhabditis bovis]